MKKTNNTKVYTCISGDMYLEKAGTKDRPALKLLMVRYLKMLSV